MDQNLTVPLLNLLTSTESVYLLYTTLNFPDKIFNSIKKKGATGAITSETV